MKNLINLYLKKEINEKEFTIIYAKKVVLKIKMDSSLILYEGEQLSAKDNKLTNINFSKSDFPLQNLETNTTTYKKTQEIDTISLINCAKEIYFLKKLNQ